MYSIKHTVASEEDIASLRTWNNSSGAKSILYYVLFSISLSEVHLSLSNITFCM